MSETKNCQSRCFEKQNNLRFFLIEKHQNQRIVGLGYCFKLLLKNRNRPPMVIRSVPKIHNSRSPKQIKDNCYESQKKKQIQCWWVKKCTCIGSKSRPQRNNLILKINLKKKQIQCWWIKECILVSGPQRRVFFLGTSFQVRLEVWTEYWESRFRSFIEDSGHLGSGPQRFWGPRSFQDLVLFLSP